MAKSSKKQTSRAAGKSTTKAKATASKPSRSTSAKAPATLVRSKTPTTSGAGKSIAAKPLAAKPLPRITTPPKSKSVLTRTDKHDRDPSAVRPSNGKQAARPLPRVTPPPAAPKSTNAKSRLQPQGNIVVMPVPKPGKNAAGLSARELEHFRELLLAKRRELVGDMYSMEREALQRSGENLSNLPIHMADMGTDNYEQEFTLGLVEKDRQLLREISSALLKIRDGTFGMCEGTGKPINHARLEAKPWAKYSIEYTRKMERGLVRG